MQTLKGSDFNCDFPLPDEGDEFLKNPHSECRTARNSYQKSETQQDDKRIIRTLVRFPNRESNWPMRQFELRQVGSSYTQPYAKSDNTRPETLSQPFWMISYRSTSRCLLWRPIL